MRTFKLILFYLLSFTWGAIMSFIGLIVIGICACLGKVKIFHNRLYGHFGNGWGGLELGCFFVCSNDCVGNDRLCGHECGHGLQNILWGPLFPFVIGIPSALRYWWRELICYKYKKHRDNPESFWYKKYKEMPPYDAIWFENQATEWGKKYILTNKW